MELLTMILIITNIILAIALFIAYLEKLDREYEARNRTEFERADRKRSERLARDEWYRAHRHDWHGDD